MPDGSANERERNDPWTCAVETGKQVNGYDGWHKSEEKLGGDGSQDFASGHPVIKSEVSG